MTVADATGGNHQVDGGVARGLDEDARRSVPVAVGRFHVLRLRQIECQVVKLHGPPHWTSNTANGSQGGVWP